MMVKHKNFRGHKTRRKRNPKSVILIALEGKNKTEETYLDNFNSRNKSYKIQYASGNDTDPLSLVRTLVREIKKPKYNIENGDAVYCVFDVDTNPNKNEIIKQAIKLANENKIKTITSAPCFELWLLLHYEYTTAYMDDEEVIKRLKQHYPKYKKSIDVYPAIKQYLDVAINNAKKLEKHQLDNNRKIGTVEANPNTEFYKIVEYLKSLEENDGITLGQMHY